MKYLYWFPYAGLAQFERDYRVQACCRHRLVKIALSKFCEASLNPNNRTTIFKERRTALAGELVFAFIPIQSTIIFSPSIPTQRNRFGSVAFSPICRLPRQYRSSVFPHWISRREVKLRNCFTATSSMFSFYLSFLLSLVSTPPLSVYRSCLGQVLQVLRSRF